MLVLNADRALPSGAEATLVAWARTWQGENKIAGVAISGCFIRDRKNRSRSNEADLVVITPGGCAVVEVKGMLTGISGELRCPGSGPWTIEGVPGPVVHVRASDQSPYDQVSDGVWNLQRVAARVRKNPFIDGLVIVFPQHGQQVRVRCEGFRQGIDVIVGQRDNTRDWFARLSRKPPRWSAQQAHELLTALNFGHAVTVQELEHEFSRASTPPGPTGPDTTAPPVRPRSPRTMPGTTPRARRPRLSAEQYEQLASSIERPPWRPTPLAPAWAPIAARHGQIPTEPLPPGSLHSVDQPPRAPAFTGPVHREPTPAERTTRRRVERILALVIIATVLGGLLLYGRHQLAESEPSHDPSPPQLSQTLHPTEPRPN